jgi:hypothetical protein
MSIWYSTIPSTWCAKKETFSNGVSCVAHHKRGFLVLMGSHPRGERNGTHFS